MIGKARYAWVGGMALALAGAGSRAADPGDWSSYGGAPGGGQHSPLTQITPANVGRLRIAWSFRTGELGAGLPDPERRRFEANPLVVGGRMYLNTGTGIAFGPKVYRTVRFGVLANFAPRARGESRLQDRDQSRSEMPMVPNGSTSVPETIAASTRGAGGTRATVATRRSPPMSVSSFNICSAAGPRRPIWR